jgi:hypothetical protein
MGQEGSLKFDFGYLILENNNIIKHEQILKIKWNWTDIIADFYVLGFLKG